MSKILTKEFFNRDTALVAKNLLGKYLVIKKNKKINRFIITETEAYIGSEDKACHASKGKTERTKVMFGPPGYFYVYLVYGMHWMLNVVTEQEGHPSAVLIRGLRGYAGPGKLTKALRINKSIYGKPVSKDTGIWFEDNSGFVTNIKSAPRIGVDYAGNWANKKLRFLLVD